MIVDTSSGLLQGAHYIPSPNADPRPPGTGIDLLVIHNISLPPSEFGGDHVRAFFCNELDPTLHPYFAEIADRKVSSHLFIRRDGQIVQFVPFTERAWHAGQSVFQGRERCNDFSIGIELEGTDTTPYTASQYKALIAATLALQEAYPAITTENIAGHCDIAPLRKTDPGAAFDWIYYRNAIGSQKTNIIA